MQHLPGYILTVLNFDCCYITSAALSWFQSPVPIKAQNWSVSILCHMSPIFLFDENMIAACQVVQLYTVSCGIHSCHSIATAYGVIVTSICFVCLSVCAVRFMVTRIPSFWEARHRSRPALCPRLWPGSLRRRDAIYCPSQEPPCHLLHTGTYSSQ